MSYFTDPIIVSFPSYALPIPALTESIFVYYDATLREKVHRYWNGLSERYSLNWLESRTADKSIHEVLRIWQWLHEGAATRHSLLVCVGGGRITDVGGFAASTFKRGVAYINIPTTLLSMVDASLGGKTGFNYGGVKNEIGTFYPSSYTLIDTSWLTTLPEEEIWSGYAEMIKHGMLADSDAYYRLLSTDPMEHIEDKISRSVAVKKLFVSIDGDEKGLRKALNFGHTIGHALESKYRFRHGYAVMYGMVAELYLSVVLKGLDKRILQQMSHYMSEHYGKPICKCEDYDDLLGLMRQDKKNRSSEEITFTLLSNIGTSRLDEISDPANGICINEVVSTSLIKEALDYLYSI